MTFEASVVLLFGVILSTAAAIGLSIAFGPKIAGTWTALALCAASIGFVLSSRPINGTVTGKTEHLDVSMHGLNPGVTRQLDLTIAVSPALAVRLDASERLFDSLHEGDPIVLRGLRFGRVIFAIPEASNWWNSALDALKRRLPVVPSGPPTTVSATVISTRTIRDADVYSWFSGSNDGDTHVVLRKPYDEVRLRFVSESGAPIVILDRVDTGSAGVIHPGSNVPVIYHGDRPRTALLVNGRRSFAWSNALSYWGGIGTVLGVILVLGAAVNTAGKAIARRSEGIRSARRR